MHIGSQILSLAPFRAAFARTVELVRALREAGHKVQTVDCGGGLGIPYREDDEPPPDRLSHGDLGRLRDADRFREANELRAWIEVEDGAVVGAGYGGGGLETSRAATVSGTACQPCGTSKFGMTGVPALGAKLLKRKT